MVTAGQNGVTNHVFAVIIFRMNIESGTHYGKCSFKQCIFGIFEYIMKSPHLLNLGNVRKLKENLSGILGSEALNQIESEIEVNVTGLLALAEKHFQFAQKLSANNWRQKISRLYYAAYNAGRAVRLYVKGEYSTDVKDHQKIMELPEDFPNIARYKNQLSILREDRNISDYDHISKAKDLALGTSIANTLVSDFLKDVKNYLKGKGLK